MTFSTTAIILRRRDYGEWDRLYVAYTRDHGKLTLIGKGARRPQAKLAAHLEPYSEAELVIANGRAIDRVTFARTITSGARFAADWEAIRCVAFIAECVDQLTHDGHRDPTLYDLLRDALSAVEAQSSATLTTPFLLRLLSILGYAPQLNRCIECHSSLPSGSVLGLPLRGGVACSRCATLVRNGIPLTNDDRGALVDASASFRCFSPSPALAAFAQEMLEAHLWQPLQTTFFATALTNEPAAATMTAS